MENSAKRKVSYSVTRGNLEALVLHVLSQESKTALQIIEFLDSTFGVRFSAGTIYPKLWMLEKEGCVKKEEHGTKFELTKVGKERLKQNIASLLLIWKNLGETLK